MRSLILSTVLLLLAGALLAYLWGGTEAAFAAVVLALLEISLSFDNAVVNAVVLSRMNRAWQDRFLSWGIPIAVFGTRFLFPLAIVAVVASLSPLAVLRLALFNGAAYGAELEKAHVAIAAFGGAFLLMVFLSFFLNDEKRIHWLRIFEHWLSKIGELESAPLIAGSSFVLLFSMALGAGEGSVVLQSGLTGLLIFILIKSFTAFLENREKRMIAAHAGLSLFIYLQFLDASFSLDSVIGAFAINSDIIIIALGLGIGAFVVRSLTLFFVRLGTLSEYLYLEHGAHYAIGALAFLMFLSIPFRISEVFTGTIGILFIGAALLSSLIERRSRS